MSHQPTLSSTAQGREQELHRLADSFRLAAANPAATPLSPRWVEGFVDGLRFAAATLDAIAVGETQAEAIVRAMAAVRG